MATENKRVIQNIRDYVNGTGQFFSARNKTAVLSQLRDLEHELDRMEQLKELWREFIATESRGESQRAADVVERAAALLASAQTGGADGNE